jgi:riboflavin synthase
MFTGLVEAVGRVVDSEPIAGGVRIRIATSLSAELTPGDSLAVNGVCLTVVAAQDGEVSADIGPETSRVTTLGALRNGAIVNLERPLRADSRLGGHFVQGHVDAVGHIEQIRAEADFHWVSVRFPPQLAPYVIQKGSIAVDGISLTIARLGVDRFEIQIVPFTMEHTNLHRAHANDAVNLECDMVGKYVVRAAELAGLNFNSVQPGEVTH